MELREVLRHRRMVRRYDPARPVASESLDAVIDAARRAPSAGFTQGVRLLALTEAADRAQFWAATADPAADPATPSRWLAGMQTAPALLLVWTSERDYLDRYAEADKGWVDRDPARWSAPYWYVDAGMAVMAALLRCVDEGLGACFFGVPAGRVATVREAYGVPDDQLSVGVISVGYPVAGVSAAGSPSRRARRPLGDVLRHGRW